MPSVVNPQHQVVVLTYSAARNLNNSQFSKYSSNSNTSNNNSVGLTHLAVLLNSSLLAVSTHLLVEVRFNNCKVNRKVSMHLARSNNHNKCNNSRSGASMHLAHHHQDLSNREVSMRLVILKAKNRRRNKIHLELSEIHRQQHQLLQLLMLLVVLAQHQVKSYCWLIITFRFGTM